MSYILDALRKADAERERDPARGIHAQPAALPADAVPRFPSWILGAIAVLAVVAAGAAWLMRPAAAPAPVVAAAAPTPAAAPTAARETSPQVIQVAATVSPPAPPPLPAPERVVAKPVPIEIAKAAPAAKPLRPASAIVLKATPATSGVARAPAPVAAAAAVPAPAADRILTVAELPPDVQQSLPKLQISGGVYSDNAAQRMLIVGGQVMNEGAELAPGAVLEQIKPHAAVLKFKGYRYTLAY